MIALVVGFGGKSGVAAVNFLLEKGYFVRANDIKKAEELTSWIDKVNKEKVEFVFGSHNISALDDVDMVVISPGVPSNIELIKEAKRREIPVLSEVELAYMEYPYNWICITGTDGKSTTTSLIGNILKEAGKKVIVAGNIGVALTEKLLNLKEKDYYIVAELSSFQLENIRKLKPYISLLLNVAEDHLDRYNNMEEYAEAKFNIFKNQSEDDYAIINSDSHYINLYLNKDKIRAKKYYFSRQKEISPGTFYKDKKFIFVNSKGKKEVILKDENIKLLGKHNRENILAAITTGKILNIKNSIIKKAIEDFTPLEHRTELVAVINNRKFINDSKATTISSVNMSLSAFDEPIIAILGGRDKGLDFSLLNETLNNKVKYLILIGEAREKIKNMINYPEDKIYETDDMEDAVNFAYKISKEGDIIILAPGCTSYDMYKNFEERGKHFKELVLKLKDKIEV